MNTNIPELAFDEKSGKYVSHFRSDKGYPDHKWFTRDEREFRILHAHWVASRYGVQLDVSVPLPATGVDG